MTDRHAGSFPRSSGVSDPGPGARSPALRETPLLRATGDGGGTPVTGGTISIHLDGRVGDDALVSGPGGADWMGDGTCGGGTAAADAEGRGSGISLFFGDRVVERPGEGWEAVRSGVDFALPGDVEGLLVGGGARTGRGRESADSIVGDDTSLVNGRGDRVVEEGREIAEAWAAIHQELPANLEDLFWDGAAAWGSVDGRDDRPPGRVGGGTLTGGAGDDISSLLATAPFRATIEDFWPSAGPSDRSACSRGRSPSREQVVAAFRQQGDDAWVVLEGRPRAVSQDSGLADAILDDLLVV